MIQDKHLAQPGAAASRSIEMIRSLVGFPTVSRESNLELIDFVRELLRPFNRLQVAFNLLQSGAFRALRFLHAQPLQLLQSLLLLAAQSFAPLIQKLVESRTRSRHFLLGCKNIASKLQPQIGHFQLFFS